MTLKPFPTLAVAPFAQSWGLKSYSPLRSHLTDMHMQQVCLWAPVLEILEKDREMGEMLFLKDMT